MITSNVHIIREAVILLLRQNGYSVLEAVDKWDNVYSVQYEQARPGTWHTWKIGDYDFEFTKTGEPKITQSIPTEHSNLSTLHLIRNLSLIVCATSLIALFVLIVIR